MIKLTQTANSEWFMTENRERIYLCNEESEVYLGGIPKEIKVYSKNPKEKGAIKCRRVSDCIVEVKNNTVWIDETTDIFIHKHFKDNFFWVKVKNYN